MAAPPITIDQLLQGNKEYASHHVVPPTMPELQARAAAAPGPFATCIITCSDPRVVPESFFNFSPGRVTVVRNACGRAQDALRSVLVIDHFVRGWKNIMIVHHTDCGGLHVTDEQLHKELREAAPDRKHEIDAMTFGAFTDLEQSVREDMDIVKSWPGLRSDINVSGYIYDLSDGIVREVKP